MGLKRLWKDMEASRSLNEQLELADAFKVEDRNGSLYLTMWGTAFYEVDSSSSAEDICALLDDARSTALKFIEQNGRK
jgi:hypothetical protein